MVSDLSFVYCHFNHCYTDLMRKMYSTIQTNVTPDKQYFDNYGFNDFVVTTI